MKRHVPATGPGTVHDRLHSATRARNRRRVHGSSLAPRLFSRVFCSLACLCAVTAGAAEAYPARPIRCVVPFPPGGGNDLVARIVAARLGDGLGQPVVIDNRGGAGGTIGTDLVAKAPPDGYTVLVNNISLAVNHTLFSKLPYDTLNDLAPVGLIGRQPNLVVVHPALPARSVRELLELARSRPGQLSYGSGGVGTASHLATEMVKLMARVDLTHVPYKGLGPALTDLMSGRVDIIVSTLASAMPQVKTAKLRPLAVTTRERSAFYPEVPTMGEAGIKGYEFSTWYGAAVPARTQAPVVARLNTALRNALSAPQLREQFAAQGLEPAASTPPAFGAYLASEVEKWARVVKASGATTQ